MMEHKGEGGPLVTYGPSYLGPHKSKVALESYWKPMQTLVTHPHQNVSCHILHQLQLLDGIRGQHVYSTLQ